MLEVTFNEDQSRIRRSHGPEDSSRLRPMALNELRACQDPSGKMHSIRTKRKKCSWSSYYFLTVLTA
jgi:hypothetical protein